MASVNLAELFKQEDSSIQRIRADNLFKQLDERQLTDEEERIIQQRVELQRKMFQEYQRREELRKIRDLQSVIPALDAEGARRALEGCNWREDDAAVRFSSDPVFQRMVMRQGSSLPPSGRRAMRPAGQRPKVVDPSLLASGGVFVGRFKSKLGPYQSEDAVRGTGTSEVVSCSGSAGLQLGVAVAGVKPRRRGSRSSTPEPDALVHSPAASAAASGPSPAGLAAGQSLEPDNARRSGSKGRGGAVRRAQTPTAGSSSADEDAWQEPGNLLVSGTRVTVSGAASGDQTQDRGDLDSGQVDTAVDDGQEVDAGCKLADEDEVDMVVPGSEAADEDEDGFEWGPVELSQVVQGLPLRAQQLVQTVTGTAAAAGAVAEGGAEAAQTLQTMAVTTAEPGEPTATAEGCAGLASAAAGKVQAQVDPSSSQPWTHTVADLTSVAQRSATCASAPMALEPSGHLVSEPCQLSQPSHAPEQSNVCSSPLGVAVSPLQPLSQQLLPSLEQLTGHPCLLPPEQCPLPPLDADALATPRAAAPPTHCPSGVTQGLGVDGGAGGANCRPEQACSQFEAQACIPPGGGGPLLPLDQLLAGVGTAAMPGMEQLAQLLSMGDPQLTFAAPHLHSAGASGLMQGMGGPLQLPFPDLPGCSMDTYANLEQQQGRAHQAMELGMQPANQHSAAFPPLLPLPDPVALSQQIAQLPLSDQMALLEAVGMMAMGPWAQLPAVEGGLPAEPVMQLAALAQQAAEGGGMGCMLLPNLSSMSGFSDPGCFGFGGAAAAGPGQQGRDQAARAGARALTKMVSRHAQMERLHRMGPELASRTLAELQLLDDDLAVKLLLALQQEQGQQQQQHQQGLDLGQHQHSVQDHLRQSGARQQPELPQNVLQRKHGHGDEQQQGPGSGTALSCHAACGPGRQVQGSRGVAAEPAGVRPGSDEETQMHQMMMSQETVTDVSDREDPEPEGSPHAVAAGGRVLRGSGMRLNGGLRGGAENEDPNLALELLGSETEEDDEQPKRRAGRGRSRRPPSSGGLPRIFRQAIAPASTLGTAAISARGHTKRGRIKQKGTKKADLVELGTMVFDKSWCNAGYIFTCGFKSRLLFRSSVNLDALCVHECEILGEGGEYWPAPTFSVTAMDRPDEPILAKSCTGCWSGILRRINEEIEARRREGQDLPPPPKTAIAGPEYFGMNQHEVVEAIEALDPEHKHQQYWAGKAQREAVLSGAYDPGPGGGYAPAQRGGGGGGRGGGRGRKRTRDLEEELGGAPGAGAEEEEGYAGNKWSAISRAQRYRQRCVELGDGSVPPEDDNPLPGTMDPITLEPVVNPAISPYCHVMGLATWKAVLQEHQRCPFTKNPLSVEQLVVLNVNNIERYRHRIIQP